jgi:t-SNARE complex subunit (syntaxin)
MVQNEIKQRNQEEIKRQIKVARPDASERDIEEALESGNVNVFASELLKSNLASQRDKLSQVQERDKRVKKLLEDLYELNTLVNELRDLIMVCFFFLFYRYCLWGVKILWPRLLM